jgi:hypothetical protein
MPPNAAGIQLFAQAGDVDGQGVVVDEAVAVPQALHERVAADRRAAVLHQREQYAALVLGKLQLFAFVQQHALPRVQRRPPVRKRVGGAREGVRAAQQRADFRDHHVHVEGLGDVVVPAHGHCHDHVHAPGIGGDEHNRGRGNTPDPLAPVIAAVTGQGDVHQRKLRRRAAKHALHVADVVADEGAVAPLRKPGSQQAGDGRVVLHDHDGEHALTPAMINPEFLIIIAADEFSRNTTCTKPFFKL